LRGEADPGALRRHARRSVGFADVMRGASVKVGRACALRARHGAWIFPYSVFTVLDSATVAPSNDGTL